MLPTVGLAVTFAFADQSAALFPGRIFREDGDVAPPPPPLQLQQPIDFLLDTAVASSTMATESSAKHCFLYFLYTFGQLIKPAMFSNRRLFPASISSTVWVAFLAWMYSAAYSWSTLEQYSFTIRRWLRQCDYADPTIRAGALGAPEPSVFNIYKSIKKKLHGDTRPRYPVTMYMMTMLQARCSTRQDLSQQPIAGLSEILALNVWAAITLMWFALLRVSECHTDSRNSTLQFDPTVHATRGDISFYPSLEDPNYIEFDVKVSKTNPTADRQGFKARVYRTGASICAVRALQQLFQRDPASPQSPLFDYRSAAERSSGKPRKATRARFVQWVSALLAASGIQDNLKARKINSHSFRAGAATVLAASGLPPDVLKLAGRWRSDVYEVYLNHLRSSPGVLKDLSVRLATGSVANQGETPPFQTPT